MSTKQQNLAAVLEAPQTPLRILIRPIPLTGEGELLVRNHAVAANPVDWKIQDGLFSPEYPTILGSDASGVVTAVGPGVTKFKIGDRVAGYAASIYNKKPDHGAWQTYTLLREIATMRIPESVSFEEGSTFPMAFATAAVALFANLELPRPTDSIKREETGILIWGASSSIGTAGVQLAKNLGLRVFATASPNNHEYLKSIGASEVVDYHDPDVVSNIAALAKSAGTPIRYGFDCIAEGNSSISSANTLLASGGKGSKLVLSFKWPSDDPQPDGIEVSQTVAFRTGLDLVELGSWLFNEYIPNALEKKTVVPAPRVEIVDGGIAAAQKALDRLKAGVSGTKIVVQVD